ASIVRRRRPFNRIELAAGGDEHNAHPTLANAKICGIQGPTTDMVFGLVSSTPLMALKTTVVLLPAFPGTWSKRWKLKLTRDVVEIGPEGCPKKSWHVLQKDRRRP